MRASTFGSRPRKLRYASAGSIVLPTEKMYLRKRSATFLSYGSAAFDKCAERIRGDYIGPKITVVPGRISVAGKHVQELRRAVAALVERCCRHAHSLTTRIGALPGAEVLWEPTINQGLVRFLDAEIDSLFSGGLPPAEGAAAHDRRTDEVIAAILKTGEAFFGGTTLARPSSDADQCDELAHD